jgi:hypothetical protein
VSVEHVSAFDSSMNIMRYYVIALCIAILGALLHAYENLFKADHVSLGWFAWSMAPYAVCLNQQGSSPGSAGEAAKV